MIPAASKTCSSVFETRDSVSIRFDGDKATFDNYVAECEKLGYTVDEIKEAKKYEAYNAEGYRIEASLSDFGRHPEINLDLYAPKIKGPLTWPTQGPATLIPDPNKQNGSIEVESSSQFSAYVGEMSADEFSSYIKDCVAAGFDVDYRYTKDNAGYQAKDAQGNKLSLEYQGFNTMYVCVYAAKDSGSDAAANSASTKSETSGESSSTSSSSSSSNGGVSKEVKDALDSYEKFMDGYIDFMQRYNSSNDQVAMAADYAKWMSQYPSVVDKIDKMDQSKMTDADVAYYLEVTGRVSGKLGAAAITL